MKLLGQTNVFLLIKHSYHLSLSFVQAFVAVVLQRPLQAGRFQHQTLVCTRGMKGGGVISRLCGMSASHNSLSAACLLVLCARICLNIEAQHNVPLHRLNCALSVSLDSVAWNREPTRSGSAPGFYRGGATLARLAINSVCTPFLPANHCFPCPRLPEEAGRSKMSRAGTRIGLLHGAD